MSRSMLLLLALAPPTLLAPGGSDAPPLAVPQGSEPILDGVMGEDEWRDAALVARSGTATLLAKLRGDTLFLGLRGVGNGITTVGLAPEGGTRVRILHASASLGSAEYERVGERWTLTRGFAWGAKTPPESDGGEAGRAAFRDDEGWLGTLSAMGVGESEMAIDAQAGGWDPSAERRRLRCAVGHFGQPMLRMPEGSRDDLFGMGLQMGTPPEACAFDPSTWFALEWTPAEGGAESGEPAAAARVASAVELTADRRPAAPALVDFRCFSAGDAWVYCSDQDDPDVLVADVLAAAQEFERYFGRAPAPGAVVAVSGALPPGSDAQLRAAGAHWVLPWISLREPPGAQDSMRAQIETQLREQLVPLGLTDAQIEAQLEQVVAKLTGTPARGGLGLLRHELGHVWFLSAYWEGETPSSPAPGQGHYGGPAADWLDESAAILLESEEATARRRAGFAQWRAVNPGQMRPLDELFTMTHPLLGGAAVEAARAEAAASGSAIVRIEMGAPEGGGDCPFYEQCRSLADYLLAAGGERIFDSIAGAAAQGGDMAGWLATEGEPLGLPATSAALQQAWLAWLDAPR